MMNVIEYLEESSLLSPEKIAFSDENNSITYRELLARAKSVASFIIEKYGCINKPFMVLVSRKIECVEAMLGIAMSRNFYVPVDADQPRLRIEKICEQVKPEAILYFGELPESLGGGACSDSLGGACSESLGGACSESFCSGDSSAGAILGGDYEAVNFDIIADHPINNDGLCSIRETYLETDPLYAIATSGSTGVPKVVVKDHRSVISFIPVFCETFGLSGEDVFGNQAPFDFDVSAKDIYSTLYLGASAYIIPKSSFILIKKMMDELEEKRITTLIWSVSALCIIAGMKAFKYKVPRYIKRVLFSGEVMPIKMLNIWRENYPEGTFVNLFGPTEVTGNSLYYVVDREFDNSEKLPLGVPFKNTRVLYLNAENREIGPGEEGEICIISPSLAMGYYGDPERTKAAFVENPLRENYSGADGESCGADGEPCGADGEPCGADGEFGGADGESCGADGEPCGADGESGADGCASERMYRTGDLAFLSENGEYFFSARKDNQIKHMGHRIELEEIERLINAASGVLRSCCLFDHKRNKIVAYYSGDAEMDEIKSELKESIPKYMIPNVFIKVEGLPINKNGKIDRQAIRGLYEESTNG